MVRRRGLIIQGSSRSAKGCRLEGADALVEEARLGQEVGQRFGSARVSDVTEDGSVREVAVGVRVEGEGM